ncbi:MAG: hypothetical protein KIS92_02915 [Planctomycetota bacterium]|nr:hypothetical protein [Planctomycetota bacterium]
MPLRPLCLALLLALPFFVRNGSAAEPEKASYELHEWGVFPIARNDAWAMRDLKEEWAGFPAFFNRIWPERRLPYRGEVAKPVVFFYAEKPLDVKLTVRFAEGRPLVWWPNASMPCWQGGERIEGRLDRIEFDLSLLEMKDAGNPQPPAVPDGHWVQDLREVKAARVITPGAHSQKAGQTYGVEDFLYYDGIMKAPAAPTARRDGDAVILETSLDHAMRDVFVLDRHEGKVRVARAWIDQIEPGARSTRVELAEAGPKELEAARAELTKRTQAAGLTAAEAASLVKVWREGLFEDDGLTVFYRIPRETYDAWLPLNATPAPKAIVRVGLVFHKHLEPELGARVDALIKQLASEQFEVREKAQAALAKIGGAAFPALEAGALSEDADTAGACRNLLRAMDALPAMDPMKKASGR